VARPLTPALREECSQQAYELSLRGLSARAIGRELGISHKTALSYVRSEAERRHAERPDFTQYALDAHRLTISRCWEELDKAPSPHATAQLLHALNAALNSIELIAGVRAPTRSKAEVTNGLRSLERGLALLSDSELLPRYRCCTLRCRVKSTKMPTWWRRSSRGTKRARWSSRTTS
jgi:hypothetical protein